MSHSYLTNEDNNMPIRTKPVPVSCSLSYLQPHPTIYNMIRSDLYLLFSDWVLFRMISCMDDDLGSGLLETIESTSPSVRYSKVLSR